MHHKSPRKTCDLLARKKSEKSLAQTHTNRYVLQEVDIIIMKFIIQSIRPIWRNRKTFPYCQCHYIDADLHYYDQATSWMSRHMHSTCVEIIAVAIISLNDKREREPSVRDVVRSLLFFSVAFFGSFKCFFFRKRRVYDKIKRPNTSSVRIKTSSQTKHSDKSIVFLPDSKVVAANGCNSLSYFFLHFFFFGYKNNFLTTVNRSNDGGGSGDDDRRPMCTRNIYIFFKKILDMLYLGQDRKIHKV